MAMVINQAPARDGNCLVVWCSTNGRPAFGSVYSYETHGHLTRHAAAETDWVAPIQAALPEASLPLQRPGVTPNPMLTIALARRLAAALANDSGTGHMLAAADVPLVSLFGPTSAEKFAPATARSTVVTAQNWGGEAMELIPVEAVMAALAALL